MKAPVGAAQARLPEIVVLSFVKFVTIALAAIALTASPALTAPQPLGSWTGGGQHSSWIEQQQITPPPNATPINPFGGACLWSVNDHELWETWGYLDSGASVLRTKCVVADFFPGGAPFGMSTVELISKSPALAVSVCFSQGRCFTPAPVYDSGIRAYRTTFCGKVQYDSGDPALLPIEDSQGGYGEISSVTTTVTNLNGKRVRDIIFRVGYASDIGLFMGWEDALGCLPVIPYVDHFEYPYQWTHS